MIKFSRTDDFLYNPDMVLSTRTYTMPSYSELRARFPKDSIRQAQDYVLKEIATALDQGFKMIVLEAPTGFGKSAVAVALAKSLDESYVLTGTKDLQEQYSGEYPFIWKIIGRSNFSCHELEEQPELKTKLSDKLTCDLGPCTKDGYQCKYKSSKSQYLRIGGTVKYDSTLSYVGDDGIEVTRQIENPCKYYHQKHRGLTINHTIMNYRYFFTLCTYSSKDIEPRRLIVFDEAHSMEDQMIDFATVAFTRKAIDRVIPEFQFPKVDESQKYDISYWKQYLRQLFASLHKVQLFLTEPDGKVRTTLAEELKKDEIIRSVLEGKRHVSFTEEYALDLTGLMSKIQSIVKQLDERPDNWVMRNVKGDDNGLYVIDFVPLDVSEYFQPIYRKGEVILCMSATILDKDAFCKSVGLPPDKVKYLAVSSDFPLENRPIYPLSIAKLNSVSLKEPDVQQKIASCIDRIMKKHHDQKGIIHTTSYRQSLFIKGHLSPLNKARITETGVNVDREKLLVDHKNKTYANVLMSPSLHTGLDLKDELSRFQIIVKIPYPDLGDRWIKAKYNKSQQWYSWQTALKLVQAYGRSVRSKEDWAKTYVLDAQFFHFVRNNRTILPRWFTDAIKYPLPADVLALK